MDRPHHVLENWVQELPRLLGVAVGQQLHRSLRVGEEDRDLLPLALERGLRRQDALRQMLGGIGNGGRNSVCVSKLPTARPTEALTARYLGSAVRTDPGEPCTALLAERRPRGIRSLAPWTPHAGSKSPEKP